MKTILVATDFSPAALNASNYAAEMAMAINADLFLLHVFQTPGTCLQVPMPVPPDKMLEDVKSQINKLKEDLIGRTQGKLNIKTEVKLDYFFSELKAVCEHINPCYVVMGSQGTTAAQRLMFGGHTVYAMKHLLWPLITVPPDTTFSSVKAIALAYDFNLPIHTMPLEEIKTLLSDFQATLFVLNVGKREESDPEIIFKTRVLEQKLGAVKSQYIFTTLPETNTGLTEFLVRNNIDLLVIMPKRHNLLHKLINKSHTRQMVLHSNIPVLALH
jgi:nucleotide-binding universal stress UspA family protein